jgi:hypothetical protein
MTEQEDERTRLCRQRLACALGIAQSELCGTLIGDLYHGTELERFRADYARRAADYRTALERVNRRIAELPPSPFRKLVLKRRAGEITWSEFGAKTRRLLRKAAIHDRNAH